MKLKTIAIAAAVLVAAWAPVSAQQPKQQLVVTANNLTAHEEAAAGKTRRDAAAVPGDVIEYQLVFSNTKDFAMKEVVFQDPVPTGLSYVGSSSKSTREDVTIEYSIDKGKTWSAQPKIEVVDAQGRKVMKAAPESLYTNIRWRVAGEVAPGATVQASFRTRVNGPTKPAAKK